MRANRGIAVVLQPNVDRVLEALLRDTAARVVGLFARKRQTRHTAAKRLGGMDREASPATADLEQVVPARGAHRPKHPVPLRALCLSEICSRLKTRSRIGHRLVEPERVELVAEIVVVLDVASRAALGVVVVQPMTETLINKKTSVPPHVPKSALPTRSMGLFLPFASSDAGAA